MKDKNNTQNNISMLKPVAPDYLRYDIIAKHCPEGSVEWALWQMLNGKKVCNHSYHGGVPLKISDSSVQKWARNAFEYNCEIVSFMRYFKEYQTGWKICEETEPKPEVGKWYQHKKRKHYVCVVAVDGDECRIKFAGDAENERYGWMENDVFESSYKLAPIEPDFSNAKAGDKCYSVLVGDMEISCVFNQAKYGVNAYHEKSGLSARYTNSGIYDKYHIHPALFNSIEQCAAYFAEVALKERGEE